MQQLYAIAALHLLEKVENFNKIHEVNTGYTIALVYPVNLRIKL